MNESDIVCTIGKAGFLKCSLYEPFGQLDLMKAGAFKQDGLLTSMKIVFLIQLSLTFIS